MLTSQLSATAPSKEKCVIILDGDLPPGVAANAAAVLASAVFCKVDGLLGADVQDADGRTHTAITKYALPILQGDPRLLQTLYDTAYDDHQLIVAGFSHQARTARHYADYTLRMASTHGAELDFAGVALFGPVKAVNKLTGNLECL